MWLLDVIEFHLHNFIGDDIPPYAILSHRWQEEEVSFAAFRKCGLVDSDLPAAFQEEQPERQELRRQQLRSMKGWQKVENLCKIASSHNLGWAWIDTACIDRSSSAELQEAINSMFLWYANASRCFVYMKDVYGPELDDGSDQDRPAFQDARQLEQFRNSEWFQRAWTLQELLAPDAKSMTFYDHDWAVIGQLTNLALYVAKITRIPEGLFNATRSREGWHKLYSYPVARRMSYAASRKATREEDIAYALLGIFNVNMPLLYGEGKKKAFYRLQSEILRNFSDDSIFVWEPSPEELVYHRLLAMSPDNFLTCGAVNQSQLGITRIFQLGQGHLVLEAPILEQKRHSSFFKDGRQPDAWRSSFVLPLRCQTTFHPSNSIASFFLQLEQVRGGPTPTFRQQTLPLFAAWLDWAEMLKRVRPQQFQIEFSTAYLFPAPKQSP